MKFYIREASNESYGSEIEEIKQEEGSFPAFNECAPDQSDQLNYEILEMRYPRGYQPKPNE